MNFIKRIFRIFLSINNIKKEDEETIVENEKEETIIEEEPVEEIGKEPEVEEELEDKIDNEEYNIFTSKCTKDMRITSFFGSRDTGIKGATKNHKGVDMGGHNYKTEGILALHDGTIINSDYNNERGFYVEIIADKLFHGKQITTLYQHLKESCSLPVGSKVTAGTRIGQMGTTGVGGQLHLHMEVKNPVIPIDPLPFIIASFDSVDIEHTISNKYTQWVLEVKRLQEILTNLKFYNGEINGRVTDELIESIKEFQIANNLTPDGSFGKDSREKLNLLGFK